MFNKADKRTENDLKQILEKAKETLDDRGIEYFDIIAYSSFEEKEYFNINNKGLKAFLEFANGYTNNKEMLYSKILKLHMTKICQSMRKS